MRIRPKSCVVCGRRTEDGSTRCALHKNQGARMSSCVICGRPCPGSYCAEHDPAADEAARLARNAYRGHYRDPEYRTNRERRYQLARGRCEACGHPVGAGQWECDHVVALSAGGTNDLANLRVLCIIPAPGARRGCHGIKTAADRRSR